METHQKQSRFCSILLIRLTRERCFFGGATATTGDSMIAKISSRERETPDDCGTKPEPAGYFCLFCDILQVGKSHLRCISRFGTPAATFNVRLSHRNERVSRLMCRNTDTFSIRMHYLYCPRSAIDSPTFTGATPSNPLNVYVHICRMQTSYPSDVRHTQTEKPLVVCA